MDGNDRHAIEDLFQRLSEAERRLPERDPEADALIRSAIAANPAAPYYMAQTIVVQQQALVNAQEQIAELEARGNGNPGFFGGLFGDNGERRQGGQRVRQQTRAVYDEQDRAPWGNRGGGGFLAGAAQTAVGVAGGVLLGNLIGGALFGGSEATAQEAPPEDADSDAGGDFDGGGDFGGDF